MKDIRGQLRHSRISTAMDVYVQDIPESRRRAVEKLPTPVDDMQMTLPMEESTVPRKPARAEPMEVREVSALVQYFL